MPHSELDEISTKGDSLVCLLGVDHQVQHSGLPMTPERDKETRDFCAFLKSMVKDLNISMLAEEFNEDALRMNAYSDPSRPLIPTQVGHPFRRNAATDSDRKSATFPSPLGIGGRHPSE